MRSDDEDRGLGPLEVDHRGAYVCGFPLHLAVTVRVARPLTAFGRLPVMSLFSTQGALGYTLRDAAGAVVYAVEPALVELGDDDAFTFSLGTGQSRRMLVDLSEALGFARCRSLAPGRYEVVVVYDAEVEQSTSAPIAIELRAPTDLEAQLLDEEAEAVRSSRSWGRWLHARPARRPATPPERPGVEESPLFYEEIVRALRFGSGPSLALAARLRRVTGLYAPEAAAWAAEVQIALGDRSGAEPQITWIRSEHPGLAWWMDELAAGHVQLGAP